MSYISCIVASCNTRRKPNTDKNFAVKCFSFPKDPTLKKEWLDLCKVSEFDQTKDCNRKVCIKHFKEDDFVDGLKARLLNLQPTRLKKNAVPSLFLDHETEMDENSKSSLIVKQNENLEQLSDEDTKKKSKVTKPNTNIGGSVDYLSKLVPIAPKNPVAQSKTDDGPMIASVGPKGRRQYAKFLERHTYSDQKSEESDHYLKILQKDNAIYQKRISILLDNQKKLLARIKALDQEIKNERKDFVVKVKEAFSCVLTPNQVDLALGKKTQVRWTDVEYAKAFTLQSYSKQAYCYLKEIWNYPLPELPALQQWEAKTGAKIKDYSDNEIEPPPAKRIMFRYRETEYDENKENDVVQNVSEVNDLVTHDNEKQNNEFTIICDIMPESEVEMQMNGEYKMEIEINKHDKIQSERCIEINYNIDDITCDNVEVHENECCNGVDDFKTDNDCVNSEHIKDYAHEIEDFNEDDKIKYMKENEAIHNLNSDKSIEEEKG